MIRRFCIAVLLVCFSTSAYGQSGQTVWFYRPADSPEPQNIPTIFEIGGFVQRLASLRPGEFFGLPVAPGRHRFSYTAAPARGQYVELDVMSGQDPFVEVHFRQIRVVDAAQGLAGLSRNRPIPPTAVVESTLVLTPPRGVAAPPTPDRAAVRPPIPAANPATAVQPAQPPPPPPGNFTPANPGAIEAGSDRTNGPRAGVAFSFGYSRPIDVNAFGLTTGGSFRWGRFLATGGADFSLYQRPNAGFEWDEFDDQFGNTQRRCRDTSNGQFAADETCEKVNVITGGMFDVNALLFPVMVGAGYRVGDGRGVYGSAGVAGRTSSNRNIWFLRANVGRDIVQIQLGIATHWP